MLPALFPSLICLLLADSWLQPHYNRAFYHRADSFSNMSASFISNSFLFNPLFEPSCQTQTQHILDCRLAKHHYIVRVLDQLCICSLWIHATKKAGLSVDDQKQHLLSDQCLMEAS